MKLAACTECHAQYDVADLAAGTVFPCRCGESIEVVDRKGDDAPVQRCSSCGALAREEEEQCGYCGADVVHLQDRGSLICPECLARNADDARFCLGCGVAFEPRPVEWAKSELRCPCCERWMSDREVGGLQIQECPKCFGLWAPEDRFAALVDRAAKLAGERAQTGQPLVPRVDGGNPVSNPVEYRRCPECDALMGRRNYQKRSGVIIDQCHEHGTWLDAHELEGIAGFVLSGRAASASAAAANVEANREREAARAAARRMMMPSDAEWAPTSIVTNRRKSTAVETIFDLLTSILT